MAIFSGKPGLVGYSGAKDDGSDGDNCSYKLKSHCHHQQTHPTFYRPDALPVAQPTASKHWREIKYCGVQSINAKVELFTSLLTDSLLFVTV